MLLRSTRGRGRISVDGRSPNLYGDRCCVLGKIMRLSDNFFKKYFRMDRPSFYALLENIKSHFSYQRGFLIHPAIRLAITLRFLAGGSYLDLAIAFEVPHNTIMKYIWESVRSHRRELEQHQLSARRRTGPSRS